MSAWIIWAIICVIALLLELTSGDCFLLCISLACACTAGVAGMGAGWVVQVVVACVISLILLLLLRPQLIKWMHMGEDKRVSNADALIGRVGVVSEEIDQNGYGRVAIDGDDWKAQSQNGAAIAKGQRVEIVNRESIIVTVKEV